MPTEAEAWDQMMAAVRHWAVNHLDQWDKVQIETPNGIVYFSLNRREQYPMSFDQFDPPDGDAKKAWLRTMRETQGGEP